VLSPIHVKCIVFSPVLTPLASPVGADCGSLFAVTPTVLGRDYPDHPITFIASRVTSMRVSVFKLNGELVNLVIGIEHLIAETIAGEAPEHPESSIKEPLLALNLIAYLVTA
jgi:hypothetical protein